MLDDETASTPEMTNGLKLLLGRHLMDGVTPAVLAAHHDVTLDAVARILQQGRCDGELRLDEAEVLDANVTPMREAASIRPSCTNCGVGSFDPTQQ